MSDTVSARRKWAAITAATVLMTVSYAMLVAALVSAAADDGPDPGPLFAFGLGLVPFVFMVLAFMSAHQRAPGAVLKAMGLSLLIGAMVSAVLQDAAAGLVAGFGAGGVVALRYDADHSWKARAVAVALVVVYVTVLVSVFVEAGLLAGAVLPFLSLGIADWVTENRARSRRLEAAGDDATPV